MFRVKAADLRQLKKDLEPLQDKTHIYFAALMLGRDRSTCRQNFRQAVSFIELLDSLLQAQIIGLGQKAAILQIGLQLDFGRLAKFKAELISLSQNQLENLDQAVRLSFEKVSARELEKRQVPPQLDQPGTPVLKPRVQPEVVDQKMLDEVDLEEQKRIWQKFKSQAQQFERLKKSYQEEQKLKRDRPDEQPDCNICFVGLYEQGWLLLECGHVFHQECLKAGVIGHVEGKKFPIVCPQDGCGAQMRERQIKGLLDTAQFEKYVQFSLAEYVDRHGDEYSWCPTANCNYVFFYQQGENQFECQKCKKNYCLKCRVEWHKGMKCEEYQITKDPQKRQAHFQQFMKGSKFKQCPKCKFWVSKDVGCDSMTCRCGAFFCYKCGKEQAFSHGPCECNNGAGQFGNMFRPAGAVPARPAAAARGRKNNRRKK